MPKQDHSAQAAAIVGVREAIRTGVFRLISTEDRTEPLMAVGDYLVIDAGQEPQPGDTILANAHHTDGSLFSVVMQLNADRDLTGADGAFLAHGAYIIVGVVTEIQPGSVYTPEPEGDEDPPE